MRLKILAPAKVVVDSEVDKIIAKSPDGYFCLLPHHVDFVSELSPGILSLSDSSGQEQSMAVDEGVLVKCGNEVLVATRNAVQEQGAEKIKPASAAGLLELDEEEIKCRRVIAALEAEFVDGFLNEGRNE